MVQFANEEKDELCNVIALIKKKLDKTLEGIKEIPENAASLDLSPALLELNEIESELKFIKSVLNEYSYEATMENYQEFP